MSVDSVGNIQEQKVGVVEIEEKPNLPKMDDSAPPKQVVDAKVVMKEPSVHVQQTNDKRSVKYVLNRQKQNRFRQTF